MSSRKTGRQALIAFKGFLVVLDEFLEFVTSLVLELGSRPQGFGFRRGTAFRSPLGWATYVGESMIQLSRGSSPVKKQSLDRLDYVCFLLKAHSRNSMVTHAKMLQGVSEE